MVSDLIVPVAYATLGGFLWAFGALGKRIGVEGATESTKSIRATWTIFIYNFTTVVPPLVNFIMADRDLVRKTFSDATWTSRIPFIMGAGIVSGLGGLLGTLAFAYAAGGNSAIISMVENGVYTLSGWVLICLFFQESPQPSSYFAGVLIIIGVVLSQAQTKPGHKDSVDSSDEVEGTNDHDDGNPETQSVRKDAISSDDIASASESEDDDEEASSQNGDYFSSERVRGKRRSVFFAVLAGIAWGFGPVGKRYGVAGAGEYKLVWTTCTVTVYIACTTVVPVVNLVIADSVLRAETIRDAQFRRQMCGSIVCGILAGIGGFVSTYAFSETPQHNGSALVSVIENGTYTVMGALLITFFCKERLGKLQLGSALFVMAGLLVGGLAK